MRALEWTISAALVVALVLVVVFLTSREERCLQEAELMGLEGKYITLQGCFARFGEDRWARIERIRIVEGEVSVVGGGE